LTYNIDKKSIAENFKYRNQIHHKSTLKCELIPNSEGPCTGEASVSYTSIISFFA